jgi:predicted RNA-binding Zn-ribbon protein involved in translation (DUF1610 family)
MNMETCGNRMENFWFVCPECEAEQKYRREHFCGHPVHMTPLEVLVREAEILEKVMCRHISKEFWCQPWEYVDKRVGYQYVHDGHMKELI